MQSTPLVRIPESDLARLLNALEVETLSLSECVVSTGYALDMGGGPAPAIHYSLHGGGRLIVNKVSIELIDHSLIIVPPRTPFRLEKPAHPDQRYPLLVVDGRKQNNQEVRPGAVRRFCAGNEGGGAILICGFFRAFFGSSIDIFDTLSAPIVEHFGENDKIDRKMREALSELVAEELGSGVMSAALLKQVMVALFRRALCSTHEWVERFALLKDSNVMRAFAEMAARPGANHTVESLSQIACLSRSAFMSRFSTLLGRPPMDVLRELRMRQAAKQLETGASSVEQVARDAGYMSRSSFSRAFVKTYGREPASINEHDSGTAF